MSLKPEVSLGVGLATAGLVFAIYSNVTPTSIAGIRIGEPNDPDVSGTERAATWTAAAAVSGISLIAKDPTIFVLGGSMVIVMAWLHRHANAYDPETRSVLGAQMVSLQDPGDGYEPAAA
jgi:hypothetical protein